jgi:uncharacterized protein
MSNLRVPVGDLLGSPGKERPFAGSAPVKLRLGDVVVDGPMDVEGTAEGQLDSVHATFTAATDARFVCTRCLTVWEDRVVAASDQYFRTVPDEDGYSIVEGSIDLTGPAQDEVALALPVAPLCKKDCKGLCPTCGTDLNSAPCEGHGDDSDSPFASLKDLFDS